MDKLVITSDDVVDCKVPRVKCGSNHSLSGVELAGSVGGLSKEGRSGSLLGVTGVSGLMVEGGVSDSVRGGVSDVGDDDGVGSRVVVVVDCGSGAKRKVSLDSSNGDVRTLRGDDGEMLGFDLVGNDQADTWVADVLNSAGIPFETNEDFDLSDGDSTDPDTATADEELSFIRRVGKKNFDSPDRKKILMARKAAQQRRPPASPRKTDKERKETVIKLKKLMAWCQQSLGKTDYTKREKRLVLAVLDFNRKERRNYRATLKKQDDYTKDVIDDMVEVPLTQAINRTARMTGISVRSIKRFREQEKKDILTPKKRPGKEKFEAPEWILTSIRQIITGDYGYKGGDKSKRKYPTTNNVREAFYERYDGCVDADPTLGEIPIVKKTTFRKWIIAAGYSFGKIDGRSVAIARQGAALDLVNYLRTIQKYRDAGWKIYFQDETWVNKNHAKTHMWRMAKKEKGTEHFLYEGGMELPSGEGERLIVCHIMSEDGLLQGADDIFIGVKKAEDYHGEMNGPHFEDWIRNKVLPLLPDKSLLVVDKASYHMRIADDTKTPKANGWKRSEIIEWLVKRGVPESTIGEKEVIVQLLERCKKFKIEKEHKVDRILASTDKKIDVLRTPTKHCELNPIELIWASMKNKVATKNTASVSLLKMLELVKEAFTEITAKECKDAVRHCEEIERRYYTYQQLVDSEVRPFIISITDDDEEEEEHDYFDSDDDVDADLDRQARLDAVKVLVTEETADDKAAKEKEMALLDMAMRTSAETWGLSAAKAKAKGCTCKDGCEVGSECPCISVGRCVIYCNCKGNCLEYARKCKKESEAKGCSCKGDCSTRKCSCKSRRRNCVPEKCRNCIGIGKCSNNSHKLGEHSGGRKLYWRTVTKIDEPCPEALRVMTSFTGVQAHLDACREANLPALPNMGEPRQKRSISDFVESFSDMSLLPPKELDIDFSPLEIDSDDSEPRDFQLGNSHLLLECAATTPDDVVPQHAAPPKSAQPQENITCTSGPKADYRFPQDAPPQATSSEAATLHAASPRHAASRISFSPQHTSLQYPSSQDASPRHTSPQDASPRHTSPEAVSPRRTSPEVAFLEAASPKRPSKITFIDLDPSPKRQKMVLSVKPEPEEPGVFTIGRRHSAPEVTGVYQSLPVLELVNVPRDGTCFFSAIADILQSVEPGDPINHMALRAVVRREVEKDPKRYQPFLVNRTAKQYAELVIKPDFWGGELDITVIANKLNVCFLVYTIGPDGPIVHQYGARGAPTYGLVHVDGNHYHYVKRRYGGGLEVTYEEMLNFRLPR